MPWEHKAKPRPLTITKAPGIEQLTPFDLAEIKRLTGLEPGEFFESLNPESLSTLNVENIGSLCVYLYIVNRKVDPDYELADAQNLPFATLQEFAADVDDGEDEEQLKKD